MYVQSVYRAKTWWQFWVHFYQRRMLLSPINLPLAAIESDELMILFVAPKNQSKVPELSV